MEILITFAMGIISFFFVLTTKQQEILNEKIKILNFSDIKSFFSQTVNILNQTADRIFHVNKFLLVIFVITLLLPQNFRVFVFLQSIFAMLFFIFTMVSISIKVYTNHKTTLKLLLPKDYIFNISLFSFATFAFSIMAYFMQFNSNTKFDYIDLFLNDRMVSFYSIFGIYPINSISSNLVISIILSLTVFLVLASPFIIIYISILFSTLPLFIVILAIGITLKIVHLIVKLINSDNEVFTLKRNMQILFLFLFIAQLTILIFKTN